MAFKKYINTKDVVRLTGLSTQAVYDLIHKGMLPAHKAPKSGWRLNVDAVEKYYGIKINNPTETEEKPVSIAKPSKPSAQVKVEEVVSEQKLPSDETLFVINANHYQEVIQRICAAKSSIRIMTANFKRFNLKPTGSQGKGYKDGTPFVKYLMAKAVQGVSVQIICSMPSLSFSDEWKEYYQQMMEPELFEYKFCERNHAKIVIIDDKYAYIGSANITPAGLGQGIFTPGNFEAGVLTDNPEVVSSVKVFFTSIWEGYRCNKCHRAKICHEFVNK